MSESGKELQRATKGTVRTHAAEVIDTSEGTNTSIQRNPTGRTSRESGPFCRGEQQLTGVFGQTNCNWELGSGVQCLSSSSTKRPYECLASGSSRAAGRKVVVAVLLDKMGHGEDAQYWGDGGTATTRFRAVSWHWEG